jgi:hypothetical protein
MEAIIALAVVVLGVVFVAKMFNKDKQGQGIQYHSAPSSELKLDDEEEQANLQMILEELQTTNELLRQMITLKGEEPDA